MLLINEKGFPARLTPVGRGTPNLPERIRDALSSYATGPDKNGCKYNKKYLDLLFLINIFVFYEPCYSWLSDDFFILR